MKDIMGAALLGELLSALGKSASLRKTLDGVAPADAESVVRTLVTEIERLAAAPRPATPAAGPMPDAGKAETRPPLTVQDAVPPRAAKPPAETPAPAAIKQPAPPEMAITAVPLKEAPSPAPVPAQSTPAAEKKPAASGTIVTAPPPKEAPRSAPTPSPSSPAADKKTAAPVSDVHPVSPKELRPAPAVAAPDHPVPEDRATATPPPERSAPEPEVSAGTPKPLPVPAPPPPPVPPSPAASIPGKREPFAFQDERAFVYAATLIPFNDRPSPEPFLLGGTGAGNGSPLFALDHAGMRFYLSILPDQSAGVSKGGMLLLGKQESLKHRAVHERIVNGLRLHSLILPAEAGTVVRGRDDLARRVDFRVRALFEILLGLSTLTTWRVTALVLDGHVQKMLPPETAAAPVRSGRHDPERARSGGAAAKKTDIKTLERLLNREKKLAESILQKLVPAAGSHTVESMVGLASGTSEDWKPILRAAFEVTPARFPQFARTVVACEEAHAMFDPVLAVSGGPGSFSLSM